MNTKDESRLGRFLTRHRARWHGIRRERRHACADGDLDLSLLPDGTRAVVLSIGCDEGAMSKLEAMGIVPGTLISKLGATSRSGPVLVSKGGTQLALAFGIARLVFVRALG